MVMGERVIMNREILFKAKRKDWKELPREQWWAEGYYAKLGYGDNAKYFIIQNVSLQEDISYFEDIEINPDTLCQYTGLTDKNGNKIWENDILRGHGNDEDLVKVVFGKFDVINVDTLEVVDSAVGWHTEVIATDALSKCEPFCLPMPLTVFYIKRCEYEVFGNIFDDKELLEVE